MNHIYKTVLCMLALSAACAINAQEAVSPYSKYGYGLLGNNATSAQRQMGGVGYAMNSGRQINVMNPASYARIDSLTFLFDMGVDLTRNIGKDAGVTSAKWGGGLDYITMQFPMGKRFGGSFGLVPFSRVGYSFGEEITNGESAHQGSGGLNQLYLGVAGRVVSTLTLGVNVSYLFGHTINDVYAVTSTGSSSLFEQVIHVRDYRLQFGAQYKVKLPGSNSLNLGLVYSPTKSLEGHAEVIKYDVAADTKMDTIATAGLRHNFSLPASYGAGIGFTMDNRLDVEADFTYQTWSKAKFAEMPDFAATKFVDSYRAGIGASLQPSRRGSYFSTTTYRVGCYYARDYMRVGNNTVRDMGVSCGFGFPTFMNKTVINIGFEYHRRQAHPNALLTENYFGINLGVNFNEMWFRKNKLR